MREKSRFYADYVPPDSFSDKEWFEPLRTGVRWFYHAPRRQPKTVAKEVTTTIDRPLIPLLEAATIKGLRTLPSCAGHEYDVNYVKRLQKQLIEDQHRVNTAGLMLRNTETGENVLWRDPSYEVALHSLRDIDKKLKEQHNHGYRGIQGDSAILTRWEAAMKHIPYTQVDKRGNNLNIRVRSPNRRTQQTAWAQIAHAARVNPQAYTDPEQNKRIIERWLSSAPSDWRRQFESGVADLRATGQASGSLSLNLTNALKVLGITAGGNRSNDTASGGNKVPSAVREEAMHGLALSHANNYGAWNFIGIARAIQLATQPGVSSTTMGRMRNYFSRHRKDKRSSGFGDDRSPSRGYMAWLNWGGDAGQAWVEGRVTNNPDGSDPQGRLIPEKYLAGLPPELRAKRERELGESRDAYWRGDFTPPETDRIARSMGLVKLSPYRKEAMKRGFDVSQANDDLSVVAEKALKHYTGRKPSAADVQTLTEALKQVYRKGLAAWASGGHRPGASQKSWADARVASVLTGGRAAFTADKKEYAVLQRLINKRK